MRTMSHIQAGAEIFVCCSAVHISQHQLSFFDSASQNTKSQGCMSSTRSSDSPDTSLAQRRTYLPRASARISSQRSSTSIAALQMIRLDVFNRFSVPLCGFSFLGFPAHYCDIQGVRMSAICFVNEYACLVCDRSQKYLKIMCLREGFWVNNLSYCFCVIQIPE